MNIYTSLGMLSIASTISLPSLHGVGRPQLLNTVNANEETVIVDQIVIDQFRLWSDLNINM